MSDGTDNGGDALLGFKNGRTVLLGDLDFTIDTSDLDAERSFQGDNTEFEFSFSVEIDTQEVVCPHCNQLNHPPESKALRLFGDGPWPCVFCGYPLL